MSEVYAREPADAGLDFRFGALYFWSNGERMLAHLISPFFGCRVRDSRWRWVFRPSPWDPLSNGPGGCPRLSVCVCAEGGNHLSPTPVMDFRRIHRLRIPAANTRASQAPQAARKIKESSCQMASVGRHMRESGTVNARTATHDHASLIHERRPSSSQRPITYQNPNAMPRWIATSRASNGLLTFQLKAPLANDTSAKRSVPNLAGRVP